MNNTITEDVLRITKCRRRKEIAAVGMMFLISDKCQFFQSLTTTIGPLFPTQL